MTVEQKRKMLQKISDLSHDIDALQKARIEIGLTGYASATLSSGNGSKSYTRIDLNQISDLIKELSNELAQVRSLLAGGNGTPRKTTYQVWY